MKNSLCEYFFFTSFLSFFFSLLFVCTMFVCFPFFSSFFDVFSSFGECFFIVYSVFSLSLFVPFVNLVFSKFLPIFLFFLVLISLPPLFNVLRNLFLYLFTLSFPPYSLFFRMFFHPCVFSFFLVCYFLNESFSPFSFTFLFVFFRCLQLSVKEWKSLFSVCLKKISLFLSVSLLVDVFFSIFPFLHVLVTLFF